MTPPLIFPNDLAPRGTKPCIDTKDVELVIFLRDQSTGHMMQVDGSLADKLLLVYEFRNRDAETVGVISNKAVV